MTRIMKYSGMSLRGTLPLFLTLTLILPNPAFALRILELQEKVGPQGGLEELNQNLKSPPTGLEERFLVEVSGRLRNVAPLEGVAFKPGDPEDPAAEALARRLGLDSTKQLRALRHPVPARMRAIADASNQANPFILLTDGLKVVVLIPVMFEGFDLGWVDKQNKETMRGLLPKKLAELPILSARDLGVAVGIASPMRVSRGNKLQVRLQPIPPSPAGMEERRTEGSRQDAAGSIERPAAALIAAGLEELGRPEIPSYKRAVIIGGTGNIGRGYIAPLLARDDFDLLLVDFNQALIAAANQRDSYLVTPVGPGGPVTVRNFRGIDAREEDAVASQGPRADWIFTAVGTNNLIKLASIIYRFIQKRIDSDHLETLNIVFSENLPVDQPQIAALREAVLTMADGDERTRRYVEEKVNFIGSGQFYDYVHGYVGWVGAVVSITIPPTIAATSENPLNLNVEGGGPYYLEVDAKELRGTAFVPSGLRPVENIRAAREKKLLIHNMGHAALAYLSAALGIADPAEGIRDPRIAKLVRRAMMESATGLHHRYPALFPMPELVQYIDELIGRFGNSELRDTVERIARDPLRKLEENDRLFGAAVSASEAGIVPEAITLAIAAAIHYAKEVDRIQEEKLAPVMELARKHNLKLPESEDDFYHKFDQLSAGLEEGEIHQIEMGRARSIYQQLVQVAGLVMRCDPFDSEKVTSYLKRSEQPVVIVHVRGSSVFYHPGPDLRTGELGEDLFVKFEPDSYVESEFTPYLPLSAIGSDLEPVVEGGMGFTFDLVDAAMPAGIPNRIHVNDVLRHEDTGAVTMRIRFKSLQEMAKHIPAALALAARFSKPKVESAGMEESKSGPAVTLSPDGNSRFFKHLFFRTGLEETLSFRKLFRTIKVHIEKEYPGVHLTLKTERKGRSVFKGHIEVTGPSADQVTEATLILEALIPVNFRQLRPSVVGTLFFSLYDPHPFIRRVEKQIGIKLKSEDADTLLDLVQKSDRWNQKSSRLKRVASQYKLDAQTRERIWGLAQKHLALASLGGKGPPAAGLEETWKSVIEVIFWERESYSEVRWVRGDAGHALDNPTAVRDLVFHSKRFHQMLQSVFPPRSSQEETDVIAMELDSGQLIVRMDYTAKLHPEVLGPVLGLLQQVLEWDAADLASKIQFILGNKVSLDEILVLAAEFIALENRTQDLGGNVSVSPDVEFQQRVVFSVWIPGSFSDPASAGMEEDGPLAFDRGRKLAERLASLGAEVTVWSGLSNVMKPGQVATGLSRIGHLDTEDPGELTVELSIDPDSLPAELPEGMTLWVDRTLMESIRRDWKVRVEPMPDFLDPLGPEQLEQFLREEVKPADLILLDQGRHTLALHRILKGHLTRMKRQGVWVTGSKLSAMDRPALAMMIRFLRLAEGALPSLVGLEEVNGQRHLFIST